ncbi:hypothetical protein ASPSYDRAFT_44524 [Aspergillus sydowii CBS 593.65]|uniref:Uncharacterized protein n=1 Tax=Aspergillus sydowii CBS 593.65 TaxID=1036612 RepID=A0A1L9TL00_9EURO|nr:uncharacterized protein ASPSYDRAFT_44524 [Aspergillus sydowii CBS 593.65]OJJ60119.1 hypothetical protein ASPSYDRAFT_44524 [Aspergillus sydowii CBS 593.65]
MQRKTKTGSDQARGRKKTKGKRMFDRCWQWNRTREVDKALAIDGEKQRYVVRAKQTGCNTYRENRDNRTIRPNLRGREGPTTPEKRLSRRRRESDRVVEQEKEVASGCQGSK